MGMDVFGRHPSSPAGDYFRATVWWWRPLYAPIIELCSDLLDEDTLAGMAFNDGEGPRDQETCTAMAERFERWLEEHTDVRITKDGRFVSAEQLAEHPRPETVSPHPLEWCVEIVRHCGLEAASPAPEKAADQDLREWIELLRYCGGFEVW